MSTFFSAAPSIGRLAWRSSRGRAGLWCSPKAGIAAFRNGNPQVSRVSVHIYPQQMLTILFCLFSPPPPSRTYLDSSEQPYFDAKVLPAKTCALVTIHGLQGESTVTRHEWRLTGLRVRITGACCAHRQLDPVLLLCGPYYYVSQAHINNLELKLRRKWVERSSLSL